jgi:hypothetical protein
MSARRRAMISRRWARQHRSEWRPCRVTPGIACDCKPGDVDCGRYRLSQASLPPKTRRVLKFGGGGYRPASERRAEWNRKRRGAE